MRRGALLRCRGALVPECLGTMVLKCLETGVPRCESAGAGASSVFTNATGLAASTTGQSAVRLADIDVVSASGSGAWQCDVEDS